MRALVILILVVVLLVLAGWLTFRTNGNNQATVTVETEKIEKDTKEIVEKGSEVIEKVEDSVKETVRGTDDEKAP